MCKFFSFCSNGEGEYYYLKWEDRIPVLKSDGSSDSHAYIAEYFNKREDELNKYEYNPITDVFTVDQINTTDDKENAEHFIRHLDFKTIVPVLKCKKILNPLNVKHKGRITSSDIVLLKGWDSVMNSMSNSVWDSVMNRVKDSVGDSVWDSVMNSVWDSVMNSVWASVWNSVWDSMSNSVWDSVMNSVWASVMNSVWDSVRDSVSTYFDTEYEHNFGYCAQLWERGLVPSFDGTTWRLHTGKDARIVFEITKEELQKR